MSQIVPEAIAPLAAAPEIQYVTDLLGGNSILKRELRTPFDLHDLLLDGIPAAALLHLLKRLLVIRISPALERAVGMSLRTIQRHEGRPERSLNQEQSSRTWKFAEILSKAAAILGSQKAAELWLERPAMALDQRRPIDMLATQTGVEMVETLLGRIEYGVYT